jgi:hypothetical protein
MASVRFTDVQARPTEFLDLTSLTLAEFQQLVPPFEAAFQAHLAACCRCLWCREPELTFVQQKTLPSTRGILA